MRSLTNNSLPNTSISNAVLSAEERRALLEDIGQVALALGRSLSPMPGNFFVIPEETCFPASSALAARPDSITSPLERLHLLLRLWTNLEAPLRTLLNQPDSQSVSTMRSLPLARSSGTQEAAYRVARTPRAALAWQHLTIERTNNPVQDSPTAGAFSSDPSDPSDPSASPEPAELTRPLKATASAWRPDQTPIVTHITTSTQDTWPNRLVVTLLTHIAQEANALSQLASFCDLQSEATQADWLAHATQRSRRHPSLRHCAGLSDAEQTQPFAGEHILRCAPAYRAVYQVWRALHRPLDFDWTHAPLLNLPALEPWRLYEIWCYLQVSAALLRTGRQLIDGGSLLRITSHGLQLTLTTGRLSRLKFTALEHKGPVSNNPDSLDSEALSLYYQPLFVSANHKQGSRRMENRELTSRGPESGEQEPGEQAARKRPKATEGDFAFCSRSHAMQPDIALYGKGRLILLDPKFKLFAQTEEAQEDINKMHTYSDAIVRPSVIPSHGSDLQISGQRRAVAAAWCLFPGISQEQKSESPASESIYAYPSTSQALPYGSAGVGAFQLRPGRPDTESRLTAFLAALLDDLLERQGSENTQI